MFNVGDKVKVVESIDETVCKACVGLIGVVAKLDTDGEVGGVGQSIKDPLYTVKFDDDSVESFWNEELNLM